LVKNGHMCADLPYIHHFHDLQYKFTLACEITQTADYKNKQTKNLWLCHRQGKRDLCTLIKTMRTAVKKKTDHVIEK